MLRFLDIQNLAVIEAAAVEFQPGLNILTGETGAGKSMLVEAVGLLMGGRASPDLVRTGREVAIAQAVFETLDGREVIVRREVTAQGRSRAFVDDTLVTAAALRTLTSELVELHGQHEHQALLNPESHLHLLDRFAQLEPAREGVKDLYSVLRRTQEELDASQLDDREKAARLDLLTYQLGEIDRAAPRRGEDEELASTRQMLASADRLSRLSVESYASLYEDDHAALATLGQVWRKVEELAELDPRFATYLEARDGIKSQLEDLAFFLRRYSEAIDASPARLQQIEDRLAMLERLKRKYGPTLDEVLLRHEDLKRQISCLESTGDRIAQLESRRNQARTAYLEAADELSRSRRKAARVFGSQLEHALAELAMERTRFEVRFGDLSATPALWNERGTDQIEFFISPNPGEELRPLARVASGGELSRIMLALKTLEAADTSGKTMIFDEIDAGIGGRVADVVGGKLRTLARAHQVFCITHLPQIAAYATNHFQIDKTVRSNRTTTSVKRLAPGERITEIARMMGGATISDQVLGSARELLQRGELAGAGRAEQKSKGESERAKAKRRSDTAV